MESFSFWKINWKPTAMECSNYGHCHKIRRWYLSTWANGCNFFTALVSPELLHWSVCSQVLRKLARPIAFIFIVSKVKLHKNATRAIPQEPCKNSGETKEVVFLQWVYGLELSNWRDLTSYTVKTIIHPQPLYRQHKNSYPTSVESFSFCLRNDDLLETNSYEVQ